MMMMMMTNMAKKRTATGLYFFLLRDEYSGSQKAGIYSNTVTKELATVLTQNIF